VDVLWKIVLVVAPFGMSSDMWDHGVFKGCWPVWSWLGGLNRFRAAAE